MKNRIFVFLVLAAACNDGGERDSFLQQLPYSSLTDSIRQQPRDAGLYYRRGVLLYQNQAFAAAENDLKQAWNLAPTEQHALSVVTALIKKSPDTAIQFIEQALLQLPKSVSLQLALARGFQQKGEGGKALAVCDGILNSFPAAIDVLLLKSSLLKAQGNGAAALSALEQAYRYDASDLELGYQLAFEYAEAKNKKVLPLTDSLIRRDTTSRQAQPHYLKGVYFANTGDAAQALHFFNDAIAHDYNFLDAHMDKGALLFDQKKWTEALATFELVKRISPAYALSYYWAGKCEEALGKKAEAKLAYQRAYALDKTLLEAKEAAARL